METCQSNIKNFSVDADDCYAWHSLNMIESPRLSVTELFLKGKCQVPYWAMCHLGIHLGRQEVGKSDDYFDLFWLARGFAGHFNFFFFLRFCCCGSFLKSLLNLLQYCFCFMFCFFGCKACRILAPQPRIKPAPPALASKILTTESAEKALLIILAISTFRRGSYLHIPDRDTKAQRDGAISSRSHS